MRLIILRMAVLVATLAATQTQAQVSAATPLPANQAELCERAGDFATQARTEHDQGVPLETVLGALDSPTAGLAPFEIAFFKRTARAVYATDTPGTPATYGKAWKAKCLDTGRQPAANMAVLPHPSTSGQAFVTQSSTSPEERCEVGGEFVEMARTRHDEGMPLDIFLEGIGRATPKITGQDAAAYKGLAKFAYSGPPGAPASYREAYVAMCKKQVDKGSK